MLSIVPNRVSQPVAQRHARGPTDDLPEARRIRVKAADVDRFLVGGPRYVPDAATAGHVDQQPRQVGVGRRLVAADVEDLTVDGVRRACPEERVHSVLHIDEIPDLRSIAEDLYLAAFERQSDEPADESLAIV